jgi:hypothetical protein
MDGGTKAEMGIVASESGSDEHCHGMLWGVDHIILLILEAVETLHGTFETLPYDSTI